MSTKVIFTPDNLKGDMSNVLEFLVSKYGGTAQDILNNFSFNFRMLRMEARLTPTKTSYSLNPVAGNDSQFPNEFKIAQQDGFFAVGAGIVLKKVKYSTSTGLYSDTGIATPFTFPDPKIFNGQDVTGATPNYFEWQQLYSIYNGTLQVLGASNSVKAVTDLVNCLEIPQRLTTTGATPAASATTAITGGDFTMFQTEHGDLPAWATRFAGIVPIDGKETNRIQLNLAADSTITLIDGNLGTTGAANNTYRNIAQIVLFGWHVENQSVGTPGLTCNKI